MLTTYLSKEAKLHRKYLRLRASAKNNLARETFLCEFEVQEALGIIKDRISAIEFVTQKCGIDRLWGEGAKWPEIVKYIGAKYPLLRAGTNWTGPR